MTILTHISNESFVSFIFLFPVVFALWIQTFAADTIIKLVVARTFSATVSTCDASANSFFLDHAVALLRIYRVKKECYKTHHHIYIRSYCYRRRNCHRLANLAFYSSLCIWFAAAGWDTCKPYSTLFEACHHFRRSSHHLQPLIKLRVGSWFRMRSVWHAAYEHHRPNCNRSYCLHRHNGRR